MSDILTIKFDINPSHFRNEYVDISFSMTKIKSIVDELVEECSGRTYKASYAYDRHVNKVLKKHWSRELGSQRPLLKALLTVINQEKPEGVEKDWHNGYIAAARSISSKMAYMTPGFIEAKRYSEMYS